MFEDIELRKGGIFRANGWKTYEMESKSKLGNLLKNIKQTEKLFSVIITRVLRILASYNRFQSLYDAIFNIDGFLE